MGLGFVTVNLLAATSLALSWPAQAAQPSPAAAVARVTVAEDEGLKSALDQFAAELLASRKTAGLAVGVMRDGQVTLVQGYGFADLENGIRVDDRTVFRIGSVTKQFTAAAILLLAQQGRLTIDDPVTKYLPDVPGGEAVTLRHLLNHTSGIRNYTGDGFFREAARREWSTDHIVDHIAKQKPLYDFQPGAAWSYSNSGYMLLGAVVEKVSGQRFDQFLHQNITEPLGLADTRMDDLAEILPNRASGYSRSEQAANGLVNAAFISMSAAGAAGALRSTPSDLLKWQHALFSGKVLRPDMLAEMVKPSVLADGRLSSLGRVSQQGPQTPPEYGLGIAVEAKDGRRMIGHGGSINGFNAWLQTFPDERLSIVLLTNTDGAAYSSADALLGAVFGSLAR